MPGPDRTHLPSTDPSRDDTVAAPPTPPGAGSHPDSADPRAATMVHTGPGPAGRGAAAPLRLRADRYRLGDVIGRGGMGEVCAAQDDDIGRDVAVKRLRGADAPPEAVARFLREARIQARLDHPAIVPVHDLGVDGDGRPFFAMKRLAGTTLAELLAARAAAAPRAPDADGADGAAAARFALPRLLRAFVEVCLATEYAHQRGVVHRDLKPHNVMLGDFGEVYVLDWGIARLVGEAERGAAVGADVDTLDTGGTSAGAVLGTPGYMPPEQLRGDPGVGPAADVYALGCVLFEIVAGAPLHPRGGAAVPSTLGGADARPSARGVECAPELEAACVRATAAAPADRFASARELGDAVQRYLDGDRDVQLRRGLAAGHAAAAAVALDEARAAAGADAVAARARAMREAGRALALDPSSTVAAEVVGRLMLEPPAELPPEVVAELAENQRRQVVRQSRLAVRALLSYGAVIPFLFWLGIRDWTWIAAFYGVVAFAVGQAWLAGRPGARAPSKVMIVGINVAVLIVLARLFGPYVIVPALGAAIVTAISTFPMLLDAFPWVFGAFALAELVPAALEHLGVWTRTTAFEAGAMIVRSPAIEWSGKLEVLLLFSTVALFYVASRFAHQLATGNRDAQRRLELHAWHLRQLVPAAPAPRPAEPAPPPICAVTSVGAPRPERAAT